LFGWLDNITPDILKMTQNASQMGGVYDRFDSLAESVTSSLIEWLLSQFGKETKIEKEVGNTGRSWFVAIISVLYEQNLDQISEDKVKGLLSDKLFYTTVMGKKGKVISVKIQDYDPDTLMGRLNFTQEQRDWAALLYESMEEAQALYKETKN